jgi:putative transposase
VKGHSPFVRYNYRHEKISAIAALSVTTTRARVSLHAQFKQDNFKSPDVAKFLRKLLRTLPGHIFLIWDGGRIHKGPFINEIKARFPRLHVERFPGYAPELNPVEQVWNDFKKKSANSIPRNKQDIRIMLHDNLRRVQKSPARLRAFILASELPSPPWS